MNQLTFKLVGHESGWPPFAAECVNVSASDGHFRIENVPFFVHDLSVGDVIDAGKDDNGDVSEWIHVQRSSNTTVWVMCSASTSPDGLITILKDNGCTVERSPITDYFSVSVPASVPFALIDGILTHPTIDEAIAVAYPSFRHTI